MVKPKRAWSEHQFEQFLGNLLRGGVILSAGIVAVGGVLYLIRHGMEAPDYRIFQGQPPEFRVLPSILSHVLIRRRSLIQLGLLILIATPVIRVAFSTYAFARQGDRTYLFITLIVLGVLLHSLFSAL